MMREAELRLMMARTVATTAKARSMTSQEIEELKVLLHRMQQEDTNFRVFGAEQHHYCLGPPLSESDLLAFEQKQGVRLPDDYRTFLKEAGNGGIHKGSPLFMGDSGAGPFYGLLTLEDASQDCTLDQPFPFTVSTEAMTEEEVDALIDPDKFPGVPGALALCHGGSGFVYYLVVNGPAYGTIWQGREHYYPVASSFDAWYTNWMRCLVNHAPLRLTNERKAEGIVVGMTRDEVIARCGGEWELCPWSEGKYHLRFKHLSTQFEFDKEDNLVRIILHSIS